MHRRLLDGNVMRRFGHLLDMLYTPTEIAEEIGLDKKIVYTNLIPAGLPNTKDDKGHIWIHGLTAKQWAQTQKRERHPLLDGDGYCVSCKKAVQMKDSKRECKNGVEFLRGKCPKCAHTVIRIMGRMSA